MTKKSSPGRSSQPHKIGQSKRRSREMIKQLSTKHLEEAAAAAASNKPSSGAVGPNRSQSLRRGQPNTFTVKPSPMKSDNGRRIKMSFKDGQILQQPRIQITRPEQVSSPGCSKNHAVAIKIISTSIGQKRFSNYSRLVWTALQ